MANGTGTATIDFGAFPGVNEVSVPVTGQGSILATSKAEAWIMGSDTTADHTAQDHRYLNAIAGFACGTPVAGTGFTLYATCADKMQGTYLVRWVWSD